MNISAQASLADFVAQFAAEAVPDTARNAARVSLLDSIAVAFAGRLEPVNDKVAQYAKASRAERGVATWLTGDRFEAETAALVNAVAAHALDYDDVTPAWRGHPGAVMWPAICASAPEDMPLDALLDAFAVGFEVGAQIGAIIAAHHYPAGWHSTATIGAIAAAGACCRVKSLDSQQAFHAIGLAVAQSAGLQGNFGSMAKPLQAGFAASAAVRAAALAAAGVESSDVLEGPSGFGALYGGQPALPVSLPRKGEDLSLVTTGIEVKQFPNCYAAHRAVEAALALKREVEDAVGDISSIGIEGTPTAHKPLLRRLPTTVDEARFSAEFAVACALLDGGVRFSSFTDAQLQRDDVRHLMSLAKTNETAVIGPKRSARVTIDMKNGKRLRRTVADLPGAFGEPEFMQRLQDKVTDCLAQGGLGGHAPGLWESAMSPSASHPHAWAVFPRIRQQDSKSK